MRRAIFPLGLLLAVAFLAPACGGPDDPDAALTEACKRQLEEIASEESGTPTAKSSEERLDEVTLVECAGQKVKIVPLDAEGEDGSTKDGEGADAGEGKVTTGDPVPAELDPAARETFATTCGGCHALSDAKTTGAVGPNLDDTDFDAAAVEERIAEGAPGMPPGLLEGAEATAVGEYVAGAAAQAQAE